MERAMGRKVAPKIRCNNCKRGMTPHNKGICKRCRKKIGIGTRLARGWEGLADTHE